MPQRGNQIPLPPGPVGDSLPAGEKTPRIRRIFGHFCLCVCDLRDFPQPPQECRNATPG